VRYNRTTRGVDLRDGFSVMRATATAAVFGRLISDVPVSSWSAPEVTTYEQTYGTAADELYREEIGSALATW
jgi:hypothetical protein